LKLETGNLKLFFLTAEVIEEHKEEEGQVCFLAY